MLLVAQGIGVAGAPGVLEVGAQGGVGEARAAIELVILQLGQHAKALGIAFEIEEVAPFGIAHRIQPAASGGLLEPVPDRVLAGVAERRVADIVGQAGRLHHHAQVAGRAPVRQAIAQCLAHPHAQRAAHATDLQRVGQARVDVIVAGDRVYLGLAPQAAKGTREDDPVVVLVEGAAPEFFGAVQGFAEAFAGKQCVPVQGRFSSAGQAPSFPCPGRGRNPQRPSASRSISSRRRPSSKNWPAVMQYWLVVASR